MSTSTFTYPPDFVARVKREYPDWPELHAALDANSDFVGTALHDDSDTRVDAERVLLTLGAGLDEIVKLRDKLSEQLRKRKFYREWLALIQNHYSADS